MDLNINTSGESQLLELVLGDHAIAVHVKELESLRRQNVIFLVFN